MKNLFVLLLLIIVFSCSKDDEEIKKSYITGTVIDIDGNEYSTIVIGEQTWMSENLRVTRYADGTEIPLFEDDASWDLLEDNNDDKGYCLYTNAGSMDYSDYGCLYSFAAAVNGIPYEVNDVQGVCPDGWHMPSRDDWAELIEYVGGPLVAGGCLKEAGTNHWEITESDVTNEYKFNAVPGGDRYLWGGNYERISNIGYYWTSTENTKSDAVVYWFHYTSVQSYKSLLGKSYGLSVRCIKDK